VDILTTISGYVFENAWGRRVPGMMYGVPVHFISLADLIATKRAAGRASDLEHLRLLGAE
jgi:predicted nucleotidyltransferase